MTAIGYCLLCFLSVVALGFLFMLASAINADRQEEEGMSPFELWVNLLPHRAIPNLFRIARESEGREVRDTIIGSMPYHPPNDSGQDWQVGEPLADGTPTHYRITRAGKKGRQR